MDTNADKFTLRITGEQVELINKLLSKVHDDQPLADKSKNSITVNDLLKNREIQKNCDISYINVLKIFFYNTAVNEIDKKIERNRFWYFDYPLHDFDGFHGLDPAQDLIIRFPGLSHNQKKYHLEILNSNKSKSLFYVFFDKKN